MTVTLTTMHERLRRNTARMLNYDYANLTAAQSVRLDRAAMLRLELDDCQTKKLAGQPFDTNKYIAASEALERLFGSDPDQSETGHDFSGAREELHKFLVQRAGAIERRERREVEQLREANAQLLEENARLTAKLKAEQQPAPLPDNVVAIDAAARARPPHASASRGMVAQSLRPRGYRTEEEVLSKQQANKQLSVAELISQAEADIVRLEQKRG